MNILTNGKAIRKSDYSFVGEALVAGGAVASVTFSGLNDDDRIGLDFRWFHSSTGEQHLDLELNGDAAPAGSVMVREQFETTVGREDRVDPGFTMADLVAALASGTFAEGVMHLLADSTNEEVVYAIGEGYAQDSILILADRIRFAKRSGRWNEIIGALTSLSVVVASGQSRIANNSHFKVFN